MNQIFAQISRTLLVLAATLSCGVAQDTGGWGSIDARETPAWFSDAKFGIFVHWGPYSVAAWTPRGTYSEWYQYWLETKTLFGNGDFTGTEVHDFHVRTFGDRVSYYDFATMFKAELYNPDSWAKVFERSGAKYVIMTSKHHDGFCMWPSPQAEDARDFAWNSQSAGPGRDLVGEFMSAMKGAGLKAGLYYSIYEWFHPWYHEDLAKFVNEHMIPQFKDLVVRYEPDIVWPDGEWEHTAEEWKTIDFLNWLLQESPVAETVVINDRWGRGTRHQHGGYYTTEYETDGAIRLHPWEECRGMGFSFGYNRDERADDYNSPQTLILMLSDVVSRGGNLLLDIGPRADGKIPEIMEERLLQMGEWLKTNGEAIYGTRPWTVPFQWSEGSRDYTFERTPTRRYIEGDYILKQTVDPEPGFAVKETFFTRKGDRLYAISPLWPGESLVIHGVSPADEALVSLLGTDEVLSWERRGENLSIKMPRFDPSWDLPGYAYVFSISKVQE